MNYNLAMSKKTYIVANTRELDINTIKIVNSLKNQ